MKILQINTADSGGGAEGSAYKLFEMYRRLGHQSVLAVGTKYRDDADIVEIPRVPSGGLLRNVAFYASGIARKLDKRSFPGGRKIARILARLSSSVRCRQYCDGLEETDFPGCHKLLVESNMVFAVMSWAEEAEKADRAWELIRSVVTEKDGYAHSRHGFGILLSQLKADLAASSRYDYYYYYASDRGHGASLKNGEHPLTDKDLKSPGQVIDFIPEDGTRLLDYLEQTAGQPMPKNVPEGMVTNLTAGTPLYAVSFSGYHTFPELSAFGSAYDP